MRRLALAIAATALALPLAACGGAVDYDQAACGSLASYVRDDGSDRRALVERMGVAEDAELRARVEALARLVAKPTPAWEVGLDVVAVRCLELNEERAW